MGTWISWGAVKSWVLFSGNLKVRYSLWLAIAGVLLLSFPGKVPALTTELDSATVKYTVPPQKEVPKVTPYPSNYPPAYTVMSSAGDFNGDGIEDLAMLINYLEPDYTGSGDYYIDIVWGRSGGIGDMDLSRFDGNTSLGTTIRLPIAENRGVYNVQSMGSGDFNGDGISDLVVGLPTLESNLFGSMGGIVVVYGSPDPDPFIDAFDPAEFGQGFRILPSPLDLFLGFTATGVGDVNNDGIDDMLVSAHTYGTEGREQNGAAWVIYGRMGHREDLFLPGLSMEEGYEIQGPYTRSFLGYSACSLGDFNGDAIGDFALTSYGKNAETDYTPNICHVVFGTEGTRDTLDLQDSPASSTLNLLDHSDPYYLERVFGAGDFNGDGLGDLVLANLGNSFNVSSQKKVYIVYGHQPQASSFELDSLATSGGEGFIATLLNGPVVFSSAGDLNKDGYDDLFWKDSISMGETILFGKADFGGTVAFDDANSISDDDYLVLNNPYAYYPYGQILCAANGDFDADGFKDLAFSARVPGYPQISEVRLCSGFRQELPDTDLAAFVSQLTPDVSFGGKVEYETILVNLGGDLLAGRLDFYFPKLLAGVAVENGNGTIRNYPDRMSYALEEIIPGFIYSGTMVAEVQETSYGVPDSTYVTVTGKAVATRNDPNLSNDTGIVNTLVKRQCDLKVLQEIAAPELVTGVPFLLEVHSRNEGPSIARNCKLEYSVPAGLNLLGVNVSPGGSYSMVGNSLKCSFGNLSRNSTGTLALYMSADSPGVVDSVASTSADTPDTVPGNNVSTKPLQIFASNGLTADLVANALLSTSVLVQGQEFGLQVTLMNSGPNLATEAKLLLNLPGGFQVSSYSAAVGNVTSSPTTLTYEPGDMLPGASATLLIQMVAGNPGNQVISGLATSDVSDPASSNNVVSLPVLVGKHPSLRGVLVKGSQVCNPLTGSCRIRAQVLVTNTGDSNMEKPLEARVLLSSDGIPGNGDMLLGTARIPRIKAGATKKLVLKHTVAGSVSGKTLFVVVDPEAGDPYPPFVMDFLMP